MPDPTAYAARLRAKSGAIVVAGLMAVLVAPPVRAQQAPPEASPIMPLADVRAGMRGVGYTVVRGTEPEAFSAEILGILENILPKQSLIVARLSGLGLEESGIAAGMSGSPVYIDDRLVGAVSYRLGAFATEPIAGITPIESMLRLTDAEATRPESPAAGVSGIEMVTAAAELLRGNAPELNGLRSAGAGLGIVPILTPVTIGGVRADVVGRLAPLFSAMGWQPAVGGTSQRAELGDVLRPGGAVAAQLMRGDITFTATGTVTRVDGPEVLAFGHPFLQGGSVDFPMVGAEVLMVLNSLADSQKLSAAGTDVIGSIRQDRQAGILGVAGPGPAMIPVRIGVEGAGIQEEFRFEMIPDKSLSPTFLFLGLANGLQSVGALTGDSAMQVTGEFQLDGGRDSVRIRNLFSSPAQAILPLAQTIVSIYEFLYDNPFEPVSVGAVELDVTVRSDRRVAEITRVWTDRVDLRPGDEFALTVWLRPYRQPERQVDVQLRIPDDLEPGPITLLVGDAGVVSSEESSFIRGDIAPHGVDQLIRLLNNVRSSDRIYYQLSRPDEGAYYGGRPMPSLPPSVLRVLAGDQTSGETVELAKTVLWEDSREVAYVVTGEHRLELNVRRR